MFSKGNTVRLAHIAADAGCSVATVSLVLNPQPGKNPRISETTRRRITACAERLGYRPNRHAEFLKQGAIPEIGIFLPNFGNNLVLDFVQGSCCAANEEAFPLSYCFDQSPTALSQFLQQAAVRRNCGLLIYPGRPVDDKCAGLAAAYSAAGGKIVFVESQGPEILCPLPELPRIFLDDQTGGRLVAEHLLQQGCRKFIIYGDGRTRVSSFIQKITESGCLFTHLTKNNPPEAVLKEIRPQEKTGIFCTMDLLAVQIQTALLRKGIASGQEVKLCGYDCLFGLDDLTPKLSSVFQPFYQTGYQAVKMLINRIYERRSKIRYSCRNSVRMKQLSDMTIKHHNIYYIRNKKQVLRRFVTNVCRKSVKIERRI